MEELVTPEALLVNQAATEAEQSRMAGLMFPLSFTPDAAMALISQLQLAARHPENNGVSSVIGRQVIDGLIEEFHRAGLHAFAELARRGDDPQFDTVVIP